MQEKLKWRIYITWKAINKLAIKTHLAEWINCCKFSLFSALKIESHSILYQYKKYDKMKKICRPLHEIQKRLGAIENRLI